MYGGDTQRRFRVRFSLQKMMLSVALIAILLVLLPKLPEIVERQIWYGDIPFANSGPVLPYIILKPRLAFLFIPALSLVAALGKPHRRVIWTAVAAVLLAVVSWILIRRAVGIGPGIVVFWPDYFVSLLHGKRPDPLITLRPFHHVFAPTTTGEVVDLLSLFAIMGLLISLLLPRWSLPRRVRVLVAVVAIASLCGEWVARMWSDRYLGSDVPRLRFDGHGGHFRSPLTAIDLMQGSLLVVLFTYLVWLSIHSRSSRRSPHQDLLNF